MADEYASNHFRSNHFGSYHFSSNTLHGWVNPNPEHVGGGAEKRRRKKRKLGRELLKPRELTQRERQIFDDDDTIVIANAMGFI